MDKDDQPRPLLSAAPSSIVEDTANPGITADKIPEPALDKHMKKSAGDTAKSKLDEIARRRTLPKRPIQILVPARMESVTELTGLEFPRAMLGTFVCTYRVFHVGLRTHSHNAAHFALWENSIPHRDIHPGCIMWYRFKGEVTGVLDEFDRSINSKDALLMYPSKPPPTGSGPSVTIDTLMKMTENMLRESISPIISHTEW